MSRTITLPDGYEDATHIILVGRDTVAPWESNTQVDTYFSVQALTARGMVEIADIGGDVAINPALVLVGQALRKDFKDHPILQGEERRS
jgi:hypothetical protein